jgi:hypothetical protein
MHYHMGALHPYFPDIPEAFNLSTLLKQENKRRNEDNIINGQGEERSLNDSNTPTVLNKRNIPWRSSAYPNWTGPPDFEWSLDYMPPPFSPSHRWLRVSDADDHNALNRTPVAKLTYEVWGPTYESWAIASQQHYSLIENIENDQLHLYKFNQPWDMKGERIRMNFLAILGDDVLDTDPFNWPDNQGDEDMLILKLPHDLGRREFYFPPLVILDVGANIIGRFIAILIEGTALAAHFNYMHQGGVATTDLLERYTSLAAEKVCL